ALATTRALSPTATPLLSARWSRRRNTRSTTARAPSRSSRRCIFETDGPREYGDSPHRPSGVGHLPPLRGRVSARALLPFPSPASGGGSGRGLTCHGASAACDLYPLAVLPVEMPLLRLQQPRAGQHRRRRLDRCAAVR